MSLTRDTDWEGARVVEWDGLENRCGLRSTEGSNPSLPARKSASVMARFLFPPRALVERVIFESFSSRQKECVSDGAFFIPAAYRHYAASGNLQMLADLVPARTLNPAPLVTPR